MCRAKRRQTRKAGVFQFLDAHGQRDIGRPRSHRINRTAKRFGPARAEIFNPRDSDIGQAQGLRHRCAGLARADIVIMGGVPRRLDLFGIDTGPVEGFVIGLDHQFFLTDIPAFAEARTAHRENRNPVFDAARHRWPFFQWEGDAGAGRTATAFQK